MNAVETLLDGVLADTLTPRLCAPERECDECDDLRNQTVRALVVALREWLTSDEAVAALGRVVLGPIRARMHLEHLADLMAGEPEAPVKRHLPLTMVWCAYADRGCDDPSHWMGHDESDA